MGMRYCNLCQAYTLDDRGKCPVCGLDYLGTKNLWKDAKEVRRYIESVNDPLVVRLDRKRKIELHDTRHNNEPYYVKTVNDKGMQEYLIMDYQTLADGIGFAPTVDSNGIGRDKARFGRNAIYDVSYTKDDSKIGSLNRRRR